MQMRVAKCMGCLALLRIKKQFWSQTKRETVNAASRRKSRRAVLDWADEASAPTWLLPIYAAWLVLFGCLASSVFSPPTFTLICLGLASAFLAKVTFRTPLS